MAHHKHKHGSKPAAPKTAPKAAAPTPVAETSVVQALAAEQIDIAKAAATAVEQADFRSDDRRADTDTSSQQRTNKVNNDTINTAAKNAKDTIDNTAQVGNAAGERMQAAYVEANDRAKAAADKGAKMFEEAGDLTKGNVEALITASRIAAKGFEQLGQEAAEFGRKSFEEASTTMKSFAEVRSPADMFRLQSEFAKSQFDSMIAESSKMSEQVIKLMGDVAEPLTSRYSVATERAKTMTL